MPDSASFTQPSDQRTHVEYLAALGATVAVSPTLATVDFGHIDRATSSVGLDLGELVVTSSGRVSITLHDAEPVHLTAAVDRIAAQLGAALFDGTPVEAGRLVALVPAAEAAPYLAAEVLADELDRPAGCRECGGTVRTHKPFHGGWVCGKCANVLVPTLKDVAAEWWAELAHRADIYDNCATGRAACSFTAQQRAESAESARYCRSSKGLLTVALERHAGAVAFHARRAARKAAQR